MGFAVTLSGLGMHKHSMAAHYMLALRNISYIHVLQLSPLPAARIRGGSPQWSASFRGAPCICKQMAQYYNMHQNVWIETCSSGPETPQQLACFLTAAHLINMLLYPATTINDAHELVTGRSLCSIHIMNRQAWLSAHVQTSLLPPKLPGMPRCLWGQGTTPLPLPLRAAWCPCHMHHCFIAGIALTLSKTAYCCTMTANICLRCCLLFLPMPLQSVHQDSRTAGNPTGCLALSGWPAGHGWLAD